MWWCFICLVVAVGAVDLPDLENLTTTNELFVIHTEPLRNSFPKILPDCQDCACGERNEEPRVVGGTEASVNAFPWLARLIYHKSFGCGASLINDRYVVTAAHCVKGFMWFMFRVSFGEHDRCDTKREPNIRFVVRMVVHDFTLKELSNDISLLQLNEPVGYSHSVRPVCLPPPDASTFAGTRATVAGWGAVAETGKWSCQLLEADLPVLSNDACRATKYNETKIKEVMMCAGYPETAHKDGCTGDSGGPLVAENSENQYELIAHLLQTMLLCLQVPFQAIVIQPKHMQVGNVLRTRTIGCATWPIEACIDKRSAQSGSMAWPVRALAGHVVILLGHCILCSFTVCGNETLKKIEDDPEYAERRKCDCRCGERNEASRIVGGQETGVNEFPWVVRLSYLDKFYCGGMLVNDRYVLTAAHCVKGLMWFMIRVTLGEHGRCNETVRPETRFVVRVVSHNFSYHTFKNDIALLELNERVNISETVKPVCLPHNDENSYAGATGIAAGWGSINENKNHSCVLQDVEVPLLSNQDCRNTKYDKEMISDDMICAGYPDKGKKDTCQGDSGGPLTVERGDKRYELVGVVSWGIGCGRVGYPGVYTRVTKYLYWIRHNARRGCFCSD
ncbi:hypothetical protein JYU34_004502 [Plutella xylostella]|uniref:Peptidase S1 domain-containing protein n=1 Tax=Plutella xylostella TaxID=51655 RepID=A0ABQ7QY57_PLUXY|nr:hypothetical protein JYU34_004502 [Plutella xylostella]